MNKKQFLVYNSPSQGGNQIILMHKKKNEPENLFQDS
jgi:hypothetical protein